MPDFTEQQLKDLLHEMNEQERGVGFNPARVSATIQVDRWWLKQRGQEEAFMKLDVLEGQVVASLITRQLYAGDLYKYPVCSSFDGGVTGRLADELQIDVGIPNGQSCMSCPWNQWRSSTRWMDVAVSQGAQFDSAPNEKGKACGERRVLVMLLPNFQDPIVVRLSTGSIGSWDAYANSFRLQGGGYIEQLTRISVRQETKGNQTFGKAVFESLGRLEREVVIAALQQRQVTFVPLLSAQSVVEATTPEERESESIGSAIDRNMGETDADGVSTLPF